MAEASGVIDTCLMLGKMTLSEHLRDSVESEPCTGKNFSQAQITDNALQVSNNCSEFTFDNVIGHLEDMLIDQDFYKVQNGFLEKYWKEFEDTEENKHCYMDIFNEYTRKIEDFIVRYLKQRIYNFEMDKFAAELKERKNTLEGEIFEVLLTLSDFGAFKETFLDYKAMKEGLTVDLSSSLSVSSVQY